MDNNNTEWRETPAMMLQGLLREVNMKYQADFRFESNSISKEQNGVASSILFECFCLVGPYQTKGLNQKKTNAKHIAAENMLRLMEAKKLLGKVRIPKSSYVSEEDSIGDNPVSRLHEFLQSHGFDRPSFDDDQFGNFFEVRCGIVQLQMETCARHTSKKLAKRAAAYQMVEQLEKMDIDFLTAKQAGGPDIDGPTHDVTQVKLIEKNIHSHLGVRNLQGVQIVVQPRVMGELHSSNNFIKILNGLAEKYSFEYDFLELEGKNAVGLFQMFCRLNTFPIITVAAVGKTILQAKQAAAHSAIENLCVASRRMAYREKTADSFRQQKPAETIDA